MSSERLSAEQIRQIAVAVDVSVPQESTATLIPRAIRHYNRRLKPGLREASMNSSEDFLARITVNYLRHVCSNYDAYRDQLRILHPLDRDAIGAAVKGRVLASIARSYPWLKTACRDAAQWDDLKAAVRY